MYVCVIVSVTLCVSPFACRKLFYYAREPISMSQFDTRLVRTSMLIHVNCGLERPQRFWLPYYSKNM